MQQLEQNSKQARSDGVIDWQDKAIIEVGSDKNSDNLNHLW